MSEDITTISIIVKGRVQGVWYRASTKAEADKHNIVGFVTNQTEGSVYIEASGTPQDLDAFKQWCRKGPDLARVDAIQVSEATPTHTKDFEVRRTG